MINATHEEFLRGILTNLDKSGKLKSRESNNIEFKENFNKSNFQKYAKTMAAYSNNRGGYIIFGVTDKPRIVKGLQNDNFDNLEQETFTEILNSYFSPEIEWECGSLSIDITNSIGCIESKKIGWIYTDESLNKPIMAQKNCNNENFSNGDILYRYRARSQKIKHAELCRIIEEKAKSERERLFKLFDTIKKSETANLGIVNYTNGKFSTPYGVDVEFDRKLVAQVLKKAKFIKEGSFDEKKGTPVIKVTGTIDLTESSIIEQAESPNKTHPYIQKKLAEILQVNPYDIQVLIHHFKMKGIKEYHLAIATSETTTTHKFSEKALIFLKEKIDEYKNTPEAFEKIKKEYSLKNKSKRRTKNNG